MEDVKVAQEAAMANVMDAVESALASAPGKRPTGEAQLSTPPVKRQKAPRHMFDLDGELSSDSEDEQEPAIFPAAAEKPGEAAEDEQEQERVMVPAAAEKADEVAASHKQAGSEEAGLERGSSGSEQDTLGNSLQGSHTLQEAARSVEDSTAAPSAVTGASVIGRSVVDSALHTAGDSTELTVVGSTAATEAPQSSAGASPESKSAAPKEVKDWAAVDLLQYSTAQELEALGLEHLRAELLRRGLKCGGSLAERASRLFLLRDTPIEKIDKKHLAKPAKKGV